MSILKGVMAISWFRFSNLSLNKWISLNLCGTRPYVNYRLSSKKEVIDQFCQALGTLMFKIAFFAQ